MILTTLFRHILGQNPESIALVSSTNHRHEPAAGDEQKNPWARRVMHVCPSDLPAHRSKEWRIQQLIEQLCLAGLHDGLHDALASARLAAHAPDATIDTTEQLLRFMGARRSIDAVHLIHGQGSVPPLRSFVAVMRTELDRMVTPPTQASTPASEYAAAVAGPVYMTGIAISIRQEEVGKWLAGE